MRLTTHVALLTVSYYTTLYRQHLPDTETCMLFYLQGRYQLEMPPKNTVLKGNYNHKIMI
jgi:hypothetical protein